MRSDFLIQPVAEGVQPEFNAVVGIRDLVFPQAGRYEFRLFVDKEQKGDIAIDVVQGPQSVN